MGCDIHMNLEYFDPTLEPGQWKSLSTADHHVWRSYDLFGVLAGVRRDVVPVVSPKGMPTDPSYDTLDRYTLRVVDKKDDDS